MKYAELYAARERIRQALDQLIKANQLVRTTRISRQTQEALRGTILAENATKLALDTIDNYCPQQKAQEADPC